MAHLQYEVEKESPRQGKHQREYEPLKGVELYDCVLLARKEEQPQIYSNHLGEQRQIFQQV